MMNDGYGDLGKGLGFIIGYLIEKTWIRFKHFKGGTRYTIVYACYYIALVPFVLKKLEAWLAEPEKSTPMA